MAYENEDVVDWSDGPLEQLSLHSRASFTHLPIPAGPHFLGNNVNMNMLLASGPYSSYNQLIASSITSCKSAIEGH